MNFETKVPDPSQRSCSWVCGGQLPRARGLSQPLLRALKHRLAAEPMQFAVLISTKCEMLCQIAVKANIDILVRREEKLANSIWDKTLFKQTEPLRSQVM